MRKYIDCIRVSDMDLAYIIVEALEKDNKYSVDFLDDNTHGHGREIELRVYRNEKIVIPPTMGFAEEK